MAISQPTQSAQYVQYLLDTMVLNGDWNAKMRVSFTKLTFTAAGFTTAAAGDIKLTRLPAGRIRVYPYLSKIVCPQGTSTSDLDIGWAAHVNEAGSPVSASHAGFADSLDVGGAAINQTLPLPAVGFKEFESNDGVDVVCSFDTANSPGSGDLYLILVYSQGN